MIKVWTDGGNIDIINYYNPRGKLSEDLLEDIGGPLKDSVMWCGYFNSHSSLLGSNSTDANGLVIEEFIVAHCLMCMNHGEGTHNDAMQNTEAADAHLECDKTYYNTWQSLSCSD